MATELIPFGNLKESGFEELSGASPHAFNVIVDARATMRRRPGIATYEGYYAGVVDPNGVTGLYATTGNKLFAIGGKTTEFNQAAIYIVDETQVLDLSTGATPKLYGPGRPVFAETEMLLCVTQGNEIKRITLTEPEFPIATLGLPQGANLLPASNPGMYFVSGVTFVSVAQFPPNVNSVNGLQQLPPFSSHILVSSSRILGNDTLIDKTKVRFSDISIGTTDFEGHDTWEPGPNTAGFFTAEANPDPVVSIAENTNEVFAFGSRSLQIFAPDPVQVFTTVSAIELGCAAPYSVVKRNQAFWWLDTKRRFVFSDGRAFDESVGNPIKPVIDTFARVDDCFGYNLVEGTTDAIVWTFPSAGRSFCYQPGVGWAEWSGWNVDTNNWATLPIASHHLNVNDSVNVVGTLAGRIGRLSRDASTDLGEKIKAYIETGFLDRGTSARKKCVAVRFTMRRGQTTSSSPEGPRVLLYWRDGLTAWSGPLHVSLGRSGDFDTVREYRSVGGAYRTRQWRLEFDGEDELIVTKVEEDYQVLGMPQE